MKKRIVSLLLALVMVLSLVPTTVWAAEDHDGQVRVIVENTTYAKPDAPRTGDESPVLVWMGMAALAGAAVLLMQNKKKRA